MGKRTPDPNQLTLPGLEARRCRVCKRLLPLSSFYRHSASKLRNDCKACNLARNARWADQNRGRLRAYWRQYHAANRQARNAKTKAWRQANPDRVKAAIKAWHEANPDRVREWFWQYRARKQQAAIGVVTPELLAAKLAYWGQCCWLCGTPTAEFDHVKPLSKGGAHCLANLRPACRSCNGSKQNRWPFPTHRRWAIGPKAGQLP